MSIGIFSDKEHQPEMKEVFDALGSKQSLWEDLTRFISDKGKGTVAWLGPNPIRPHNPIPANMSRTRVNFRCMARTPYTCHAQVCSICLITLVAKPFLAAGMAVFSSPSAGNLKFAEERSTTGIPPRGQGPGT